MSAGDDIIERLWSAAAAPRPEPRAAAPRSEEDARRALLAGAALVLQLEDAGLSIRTPDTGKGPVPAATRKPRPKPAATPAPAPEPAPATRSRSRRYEARRARRTT